MNLFISHYNDQHPKRNAELIKCLEMNINCRQIDKIYVVCDHETGCSLLNSAKVKVIMIKSRPSYNVFFEFIKTLTSPNDWNIIANSDIYFDSSIKIVERYANKKVCIALTRYEVANGSIHFLNRADSQDCFIFRGHANVAADFYMGVPGCDNALCDRFFKAGYNVVNPSRSIKTYHLHLSGIRTYNPNIKVPQPYKLIQPTV